MLKRAESRGVLHVIDHELRFNPNRRKIKVLIDDGFIGRPRHALITVVGTARSDPAHPWTWWSDRSTGGGLLGAQGSHQVDLLRFWLGEIVAANGTIGTFVRERPADGRTRSVTSDDFATFSLRFATGVVASVLLSSVASHGEGPRAELWGDEGSLRLDGQERLWGRAAGRGVARADPARDAHRYGASRSCGSRITWSRRSLMARPSRRPRRLRTDCKCRRCWMPSGSPGRVGKRSHPAPEAGWSCPGEGQFAHFHHRRAVRHPHAVLPRQLAADRGDVLQQR